MSFLNVCKLSDSDFEGKCQTFYNSFKESHKYAHTMQVWRLLEKSGQGHKLGFSISWDIFIITNFQRKWSFLNNNNMERKLVLWENKISLKFHLKNEHCWEIWLVHIFLWLHNINWLMRISLHYFIRACT